MSTPKHLRPFNEHLPTLKARNLRSGQEVDIALRGFSAITPQGGQDSVLALSDHRRTTVLAVIEPELAHQLSDQLLLIAGSRKTSQEEQLKSEFHLELDRAFGSYAKGLITKSELMGLVAEAAHGIITDHPEIWKETPHD